MAIFSTFTAIKITVKAINHFSKVKPPKSSYGEYVIHKQQQDQHDSLMNLFSQNGDSGMSSFPDSLGVDDIQELVLGLISS